LTGGEQSQRPSAQGAYQLDEFVSRGVGKPRRGGPGQVRRDVEDALLGVVERSTDIQRPPADCDRLGRRVSLRLWWQAEVTGDGVERAAERERRRGGDDGAFGVEAGGHGGWEQKGGRHDGAPRNGVALGPG